MHGCYKLLGIKLKLTFQHIHMIKKEWNYVCGIIEVFPDED